MNDAVILATDKMIKETHVPLEHKRMVLGFHSASASSTYSP